MTAIGERTRTARKYHYCHRCTYPIRPGQRYVEVRTPPSDEYWPGHWNTWRVHEDDGEGCSLPAQR